MWLRLAHAVRAALRWWLSWAWGALLAVDAMSNDILRIVERRYWHPVALRRTKRGWLLVIKKD